MKTRNSIFILVAFLLIFTQNSYAQNKSKEMNDYELSVDMLGLFSGYPQKVLFKAYTKRNGVSKGAYRIGLKSQFGIVNGTDEQLIEQSRTGGLELLLGYEKHYGYKNLRTYWGVDLSGGAKFASEISGEPGEFEKYSAGLTPFMGFQVPISNRFSASFELGLENSVFYHSADPDGDGHKNVERYGYEFRFELPYSLTLNFTF